MILGKKANGPLVKNRSFELKNFQVVESGILGVSYLICGYIEVW